MRHGYKYKRGFKSWADEQSKTLRSALGLKPVAPLKAAALARYIGVDLIIPQQVQSISEKAVDALCCGDGANCWSAVTIPKQGGGHIIIHNPTHSLARQESNIMHELAHILCRHPMGSLVGIDGLPLREFPENEEAEAEWLGACLQLPREGLIWAVYRGYSDAQIAEHFMASEQMVTFRVNVTGVRKQLSYSKAGRQLR